VNQLVEYYSKSVNFLNVSGAEYLELLYIRNAIGLVEQEFTKEQRKALLQADKKLIDNAFRVYEELNRFLDLKEYRKAHSIPKERWWWYLDEKDKP